LLEGVRISLRPVAAEDGPEFVALSRDSARLHGGLIGTPTEAAEFDEYLSRFDGVNAVGFVVRLNTTDRLAGLVNINHIVWGPRPRGALGFGGFTATAGHGYVAEAVPLAARYAFEKLGLTRLDAYVQPANTPSRRILEQAGFRPVPADRMTIVIAGEPREHQRWTLDGGNGSG
jgi:ribosomal-protein-alanine N-acetyltransferase